MTRCKATKPTSYGLARCRKGKRHKGQHSGGEFAQFKKIRWGFKEEE